MLERTMFGNFNKPPSRNGTEGAPKMPTTKAEAESLLSEKYPVIYDDLLRFDFEAAQRSFNFYLEDILGASNSSKESVDEDLDRFRAAVKILEDHLLEEVLVNGNLHGITTGLQTQRIGVGDLKKVPVRIRRSIDFEQAILSGISSNSPKIIAEQATALKEEGILTSITEKEVAATILERVRIELSKKSSTAQLYFVKQLYLDEVRRFVSEQQIATLFREFGE